MLDITRLTLREMTECGAVLRQCGQTASSIEEAGQRMVDFLFETLGDSERTTHACVLARFFRTQAYGQLTPALQVAARQMLGLTEPCDSDAPGCENSVAHLESRASLESMQCLTLLATRGAHADWNRPEDSRGHQVIPLPSADALASIPMVSRLVAQLGVPLDTLFAPTSKLIADLTQRTYNIFYVPEALESPYVPTRESFVVPYGVRSVIGFGGVLPSAELFAVVLFLRVAISPSIATMFKPLAINAKLALIPFGGAVPQALEVAA